MQYVGFWPRVGAAIIDGIVIMIAGFVLGFVLGAIGLGDIAGLLGFVLGLGYEAYFVSSPSMATPGKMALGMVVVKPDGSRLTMANAIGRYFAKILSSLILCIGYIMVAFTQNKQGLHDMIAKTVVIKKPAAAA